MHYLFIYVIISLIWIPAYAGTTTLQLFFDRVIENLTMGLDMDPVLEIYGHRGFAGLFPENTLVGYKEALKLGVDSLDVDIALTKDNIVVASHDPFLNKDLTRVNHSQDKWLRDNNIKIIDLTYSELKQYDVGAINPSCFYSQSFPLQKKLNNVAIPSLVEIINLIKSQDNTKHHKVQIEIKTNPERDSQEYVEKFVTIIIATLDKENFMARAELQSFDWRSLLYAQKIAPKIKTSYITEQSKSFNTFNNPAWTAGYKLIDYNNSVPQMIAALGGSTWCPLYKDLSSSIVKEAHDYKLRVIPWTADQEEEMLQLINFGVDGIITNRPDLLRKVMTDRGIPLPMPAEI